MCFDVKNECIKKKFQECNMKDFFLLETQKESIFWEIFFGCLFLKIFQMPTYLISFIDNWLNQFLFSYEFLKSRLWSLEGLLMLTTQMITIFIFSYFSD